MNTFKTQEELHRFLLEGGTIEFIGTDDIILNYQDGHICYQSGRKSSFHFGKPEEWKPYVKKEWHEQIPEGGVWCYVVNEGEIMHIFKYTKDMYMTKTDLKNTMPITKEFYEDMGKHIYEH